MEAERTGALDRDEIRQELLSLAEGLVWEVRSMLLLLDQALDELQQSACPGCAPLVGRLPRGWL